MAVVLWNPTKGLWIPLTSGTAPAGGFTKPFLLKAMRGFMIPHPKIWNHLQGWFCEILRPYTNLFKKDQRKCSWFGDGFGTAYTYMELAFYNLKQLIRQLPVNAYWFYSKHFFGTNYSAGLWFSTRRLNFRQTSVNTYLAYQIVILILILLMNISRRISSVNTF